MSLPEPLDAVWLMMLPCVELTATLPPVMVPEVLVTLPTETMFSALPPLIVPPVLVSEVTLEVRRVGGDHRTGRDVDLGLRREVHHREASTTWPLTSVCTIQTMSCFSPACCSGVSASP